MLGAGSTTPDVDLDQILASLDGDTRSYLLLLLAGAPGVQQPRSTVPALQGTFKRFEPLDRDTRTFATLLSKRSATSGSRSTTSSVWPPRSAASTGNSRR